METGTTQRGCESVWDYPRPPRVEETARHIVVVFNGVEIANTRRARRVLETSHPPVYYLPPEDVRMDLLRRGERHTWCEWKGRADYLVLTVGDRTVENAAWTYPDPTPGFESIRDHLAFYPSKMDACVVDGEPARAQAGGFYGGWITDDVCGPFKGEPGASPPRRG